MEKNIFVNDTAAAYYNEKFINYKIDMEKGEGGTTQALQRTRYFLPIFYQCKGELIHKAASRMELSEFIDEGRKALDPARSLTAMEKAFNSGQRSKENLLSYALACKKLTGIKLIR